MIDEKLFRQFRREYLDGFDQRRLGEKIGGFRDQRGRDWPGEMGLAVRLVGESIEYSKGVVATSTCHVNSNENMSGT